MTGLTKIFAVAKVSWRSDNWPQKLQLRARASGEGFSRYPASGAKELIRKIPEGYFF